jgi:hypothetical protein
MQRARPYCGENSESGRHITESLTSNPELENGQDPQRTSTVRFTVHCLTRFICGVHLRYLETIANLSPADVYFGRGQTILPER